MRFLFFSFLLFSSLNQIISQNTDKNEQLDSIFINEVQDYKNPDKVLHAEPLYIDLIRDLGARKGEKEWNIGFGLTDKNNFDEFLTLIEYEWAPINRLGFEIELPFTFYQKNATGEKPENRLNSIKLATQYSFFVSEKLKTSLAFGYIHEFELNSFNNYGSKNLYTGNIYNPFFIAAKRWGNNVHTLLYTGPKMNHHFESKHMELAWQINSNFHYMISGTRNFIGIELNKEIVNHDFDMTIRPQMRLQISDNLMIGIVTGLPISREKERFSTFFRLIYEPKH
jgi:hypothetical protein